ncbi:polysaccharide deacetylase family protein [Simiduia litorea]|uniref:polysaccharide deacetylase family protein n=1 Tax=Simiduia litorea TaxID=1435348 RepID=UPI0036F4150F
MTRKNTKILMYHRVINNPFVPAVTPEEFDRHMGYLKRHFNVLPIRELLKAQASGEVPNNAIAITFDDGHQDFYTHAWPILKKYNLPATLYVTTGFIDNQCWLWPDLLRHILLTTPAQHVVADGINTLPLTEAKVLSTWNTIASYCLNLSSDERTQYISNLASQLNVDIAQKPSPLFCGVSWDNLREMASEGLDVGSHTVSHRILSNLSDEELTTELATSKQRIEDELGNNCTGICYPNGMLVDISPSVDALSLASGYRYGVVAFPAQDPANRMRVGRWPAPKDFRVFKRLVNGVTRRANITGERA